MRRLLYGLRADKTKYNRTINLRRMRFLSVSLPVQIQKSEYLTLVDCGIAGQYGIFHFSITIFFDRDKNDRDKNQK